MCVWLSSQSRTQQPWFHTVMVSQHNTFIASKTSKVKSSPSLCENERRPINITGNFPSSRSILETAGSFRHIIESFGLFPADTVNTSNQNSSLLRLKTPFLLLLRNPLLAEPSSGSSVGAMRGIICVCFLSEAACLTCCIGLDNDSQGLQVM